MLKKLFKILSNQRLIPGIGEFKETLSQALFWGSIVNYVMVAATFYYTTLRMVAPWFRLHWFVLTIFIGAVIIYIVEFKYVVPSIWAFRGKQMDLRNKTKKAIRVAVSGGFDPLHYGHVRYIKEAMKLGDWIIVILSTDEVLARKKGKAFMPYEERKEIIEAIIGENGEVVPNINKDGLDCIESIRLYKPNIYAKGGDTWDAKNLPEYKICQELGIRIVFGVGGFEKVQSSSNLIKGA